MGFTRAQAVTGFPFGLINASSGAAVTTGVASGYVTLDGGTQTAIAGVPVHEGNGQWSVDLTAAEMTGDLVGLLFVHALAIPVSFTIHTEVPATGPGPIVIDGTSGMTIESNASGAIDPETILCLGDWRPFADLCSDDGTRLTRAQLKTSDEFQCVLDLAYARVEQACMLGGRYSPADLAALLASGSVGATGLLGIIYRCAVVAAYERKPSIEMRQPWIYEQAMTDLQNLRDGERILPFVEVEAAGRIRVDMETAYDVEARGGIVVATERFFGTRNNRRCPRL